MKPSYKLKLCICVAVIQLIITSLFYLLDMFNLEMALSGLLGTSLGIYLVFYNYLKERKDVVETTHLDRSEK